jgi:hypothetical protein
MTVPQTSIEIPSARQVVEANGELNYAWLLAFDQLFKAVSVLRDAVELMDELGASPTTAQISTAWNEFRAKLREIV